MKQLKLDSFRFHDSWRNPKTGRTIKHVYTLEDKPLYGITSVLGVIAKPALIQWAAKMAGEYIEQNCIFEQQRGDYYLVSPADLKEAVAAHRKKKEGAADVGTVAHKMVELFVNGNLNPTIEEALNGCLEDGKKYKLTPEEESKVNVMFTNFKNWANDNQVKFIASEQKICSPTHWIAGTCDLIFEMKGKKYVGDVKTYSGIYDRTPFFQTAGYRLMLEENGETGFDGSCIIRLGKDGSFDTHVSYDYESDKRGFLAALTLFKELEK